MICSISGCNGASQDGDTGDNGATDDETPAEDDSPPTSGDAYDDYIRNALASVGGDKAPENENSEPEQAAPTTTPVVIPTPPPEQIPTQTPIQTPTEDPDLYASSDDNTYDPFSERGGTSNPFSSSEMPASSSGSSGSSGSSSGSSSAADTGEPTPTPYITPDEFDVGKCCIYINGESDSAFGTEVVTAINKTRKDLGYKELVKNTGLTTCADRRTREVAALRSHLRPNGQMYYTLAPEHFKAEMIIVGTQKAEDAVDTLIKTDPASRYLVFTEKFQSIGASSFKSNGLNFTVVAFGL